MCVCIQTLNIYSIILNNFHFTSSVKSSVTLTLIVFYILCLKFRRLLLNTSIRTPYRPRSRLSGKQIPSQIITYSHWVFHFSKDNVNKKTLKSKYGCVHAKLLQSCPTQCNSMDYSLIGSSVRGIFRQVYWVAISSSTGCSQPGIEPIYLMSPALTDRFFTTIPPGKSHIVRTTQKKKAENKANFCMIQLRDRNSITNTKSYPHIATIQIHCH